MDNKVIAELLLPDITATSEHYEKLYPERNLPSNSMVTRFAPSPTGFLHLGSLFAALISEIAAHQSNGVFFLRVEDTDKKREVEGAVEETVKALHLYNIHFDEGPIDGKNEKGAYGPYKQSDRGIIYKTYVKQLIEKGLAYPCFCSHEELDSIRVEQEAQKINTGYYGEWAKCRDLSAEEVQRKLDSGESYVIRLKSPGNPDNRISFFDLIKGNIDMPENHQDIVILKSDGLPTYHFAHAVDDHLMRTTHVIRGEEWLSSVPVHIQLFEVLGFELPQFAHISTIMKLDGNSRRKLSKRKDPEISFSFYEEQGYPRVSVLEYLLNLANSTFEDWRIANLQKPYTEYILDLSKMGAAGPLFDINKLNDMSKNVISSMSAEEVCSLYIDWTQNHDKEMAALISSNIPYAEAIFSIDRYTAKPRKDYSKWSDARGFIDYFYDELFAQTEHLDYSFPLGISKEDINSILTSYTEVYDSKDDNSLWFSKIKDLAESLGFAKDAKTFKKSPSSYKGQVGDVAMVLRVALAKRNNTPNLYDIMKVLGEAGVSERLIKAKY